MSILAFFRSLGMLRTVVKSAVTLAGFESVVRRLKSRSPLILAYHNVVMDEDASLAKTVGSQHLPLSEFLAQIEWIVERYKIFTLVDLLESWQDPPPHAVAITFDDAYRGTLNLALPRLASLKIPSTLFVPPGCLGSAGFWWDRILTDPWGQFSRYFLEYQGRGDIVESNTDSHLLRTLVDDMRPGSVEELDAAVQTCQRFLHVAPHSWAHESLPSLSYPETVATLERSFTWLQKRYPSSFLPVLAYPYGLTSPECQRAARTTGHRAAFRIDGGRTHDPHSQYAMSRTNVPSSLSASEFRMLCVK